MQDEKPYFDVAELPDNLAGIMQDIETKGIFLLRKYKLDLCLVLLAGDAGLITHGNMNREGKILILSEALKHLIAETNNQ